MSRNIVCIFEIIYVILHIIYIAAIIKCYHISVFTKPPRTIWWHKGDMHCSIFLSHSHEILTRGNDLVFRGNELLSRGNEIIKKNRTIKEVL